MTNPIHVEKEILWCSKCKTFKHRDAFGKDAANKNGKQHYCKRCTNKNNKDWYQKNKVKHSEDQKRRNLADHDKYSAKVKSWYERNKKHVCQKSKEWRDANRLKSLIVSAKARSKEYGWEFSVEPEDVPVPEYCPALGLKLEWSHGGRKDNAPSLDRIDSNIGYVKGNVHIISWRANKIKNNATADELVAIGAYMKGLDNVRRT